MFMMCTIHDHNRGARAPRHDEDSDNFKPRSTVAGINKTSLVQETKHRFFPKSLFKGKKEPKTKVTSSTHDGELNRIPSLSNRRSSTKNIVEQAVPDNVYCCPAIYESLPTVQLRERPLPAVPPNKPRRSPSYVVVQSSAKEGGIHTNLKEESQTLCHTYDNVDVIHADKEDKQKSSEYIFNPALTTQPVSESAYSSEVTEVHKVNASLPIKLLNVKTKPPVKARTAFINRKESEVIRKEWSNRNQKQLNDYVKSPPNDYVKSPNDHVKSPNEHVKTERDKFERPKPAKRRLSPKRPSEELPEIEEQLEEFRTLRKQQTEDGDISQVIASNANFIVRMLDKRGGRLQLKSHGVFLYIPPDALGDKPQEIYIYVQRTLQSPLTDGFVTPVVHCGTSGLKFNTPVILTFPVNVKDSSKWELTGFRKDTPNKPWTDIPDCSDDTVLFHDGLCTIVTKHFTGFAVTGRPKGDQGGAVQAPDHLVLRVGVFNPQKNPIHPIHGCLQLRMRIWDVSEETVKNIENAEKDSKLLDTSRQFFLCTSGKRVKYDEGLNVTVSLQGPNELWTSSVTTQVISLTKFQMHDRVDESCTFNFKIKPSNAAQPFQKDYTGRRPFECDVNIGQRSCEHLAVVVRAVDEIDVQTTSTRDDTNRPNMRMGRANDFYPMSRGRHSDLCRYLEAERRWKLLVNPLYIGGYSKINFDNYCCPAAVLLSVIFSSKISGETAVMKLENLRSILSECKLAGAAEIVLCDIKEMRRKYPGRSVGDTKSHYPEQCTEDLQDRGKEKMKRYALLFEQHDETNPTVGYDDILYENVRTGQQDSTARPQHDETNPTVRKDPGCHGAGSTLHLQDNNHTPQSDGEAKLHRSPPQFVEDHDDLYEKVLTVQRYSTTCPQHDETNPPVRKDPQTGCHGAGSTFHLQSLGEAKLHRSPPKFVEDHDDLYENVQTVQQYGDNARPQDREPEENDEYPDQIHTLQSTQFERESTGGDVKLERRKPKPTQEDWPTNYPDMTQHGHESEKHLYANLRINLPESSASQDKPKESDHYVRWIKSNKKF